MPQQKKRATPPRRRFPTTEEVLEAARGRWEEIHRALGGDVLRHAWDKRPRGVPCPNPAHANSKDGFNMSRHAHEDGSGGCHTCGFYPSGIGVLAFTEGLSFIEAKDRIARYLGLLDETPRPARPRPAADRPARAPATKPAPLPVEARWARWRETRSAALWTETVPLDAPSAEAGRRYLARRGIPVVEEISPYLRFHPRLRYSDGDGPPRHFPGLVALWVDPDGVPVTVQRIYCTEDGQPAPVRARKKALEPIVHRDDGLNGRGGAIRLSARTPGGVIGVCEGVETGLAVQRATDMVVWATTGVTLLVDFEPPPGVERVVIWADRDPPRGADSTVGVGERGALRLAERLAERGLRTIVLVPPPLPDDPAAGVDWNDIWTHVGGRRDLFRAVAREGRRRGATRT